MFDQDIEKPETVLFPKTASAPRPEDEDYLYRRAEQELELAQVATHPAVVKAHYDLADYYLEALYQDAVADEAP